ncbi:monocarboxylate transporter 14-like [Lytechinus variegatus]|uniref:monocarboxylate transporter 14-like n=1 Tax=Lytechinus variegatus TaxID=7654 RepID=UPI001BB1CAE9|nr:monocarboxylate transporter 14-like [Lytechinus variegatus]
MGTCCELLSSPSLPVVVCIFLYSSTHIGIMKVIGIYIKDINIDLRTTPTDIGVALGLLNTFSFITAPVGIALFRCHSIRRPLVISGACLPAVGVAMASMATSNGQVAICLSVTGIGIGILKASCVMTLHRVAGENYNLYFSLGFSGYGFGMVLLPLLAESLRAPYGWRGGLLVIGALIAHIIPCAVGMKVDLDGNSTQKREVHLSTASGPSTTDSEGKEEQVIRCQSAKGGNFDQSEFGVFRKIANGFRQSDFYTDPIFNVVFGVSFTYYMIHCGWHSFLVPHILRRGVSVQNTLILTFAAALGNTFSRVIVGVLTNNWFTSVDVYIVTTTLNIVALLVDVYFANYYVMLVTSCVSAMSIGGRGVVGTLVIRDRASPDQFDVAFAAEKLISGLGMFLGGYLGGVLADHFASYNATFKMLPAIEGVNFILIMILRCNPKRSTNSE